MLDYWRLISSYLSRDITSSSDWFMKNVQPDAQGQLLLENAMPFYPEDDEKMVKEASSIAESAMMSS